ncbi:hypothetical protein VNO78_06970 [Psophocarpus tetragonolobus]|uniref:CFA20 domain-containing protein n=1 Tax=Psophocarpus tetragonolobus TaxID=3891 RepID=A0AAN9SSS3_PSOTE
MVQKMFKNTFQSGFLSILYSLGSKPLQIWDKEGGLPYIPAGGDINCLVPAILSIASTHATLTFTRLLMSALVSCAYERVTFGISIIPIVKDESILILHYSVKLSPVYQ